jgi:hypothetical protein
VTTSTCQVCALLLALALGCCSLGDASYAAWELSVDCCSPAVLSVTVVVNTAQHVTLLIVAYHTSLHHSLFLGSTKGCHGDV